ncbi:probable aminoacyl tRNA synthase complex-interacting multifunctional protein 2 isoform X2 [Chrysoperla carnea]|uniref:probable aminoacyl tRNA synthase complex-interacting multifunctional protein 2 isoform X2 n=1 Tax=Chrysoperla carnea TaxID=189513 RepID=UPI001D05EABE|nr:probable aminoacyl tRNA synthase complex-interacting multifunctional protein 2 isoform X2 [Chrysoperla carnea]
MTKVLNMYQLKPIIDSSVTVSEPKCMYKMKNIHESINHVQTSQVLDISDKTQQIILPEMAELEERQKKILEQLELLKNQMHNLRSELKITPKNCEANLQNSQANIAQVKFQNTSNLEKIALKIHPNYIPFYLLDVQNLWKGFIDVIFDVHVHSSVKNLPEANRNFAKLLTNTNENSNLPQLRVTIIWKEVQNVAELVVSALLEPIIGDTNILRYLARIENSQKLIYEENQNQFEIKSIHIDNVLDICYRLSHRQCSSKSKRQELLHLVDNKLGKSQWLAGTDSLSIADIALHSVIQQLNLSNLLNVNLSNWLKRYQQLNKRN